MQQIIKKIKSGSQEEIKIAKKELEKRWGYWVINKKTYLPLLKEIENFEQIQDLEHQAAFLNVLKWVFWTFGDDHFDFLKDFALKILQHPSGKLRHAMVCSAEYLTGHLDIVVLNENKLTGQRRKSVERERLLFFKLLEEIEVLMDKYFEPKFKRYKYIQSLSPSIYKSLNLFWERLLLSPKKRELYAEYRYEKDKLKTAKQNDRIIGEDLILETKEESDEKRKWDYYYDAMEHLSLGDAPLACLLLKKSLNIDKHFVAAYMGLSAVYKKENDKENIAKYTDLAFTETRFHFPKWPEEMHWAVLENRQYLMAICDKACLYHQQGELSKAEGLYRLILKLNPNDNQGIRYLLAGMFASISPEDVDDLTDEGNHLQDWSKQEKMLEEQNKKHHFWQEPDLN